MKKFLILFLVFLTAQLACIGYAGAVLQIDITRGNVDPIPIAITNFTYSDGGTNPKSAQDIPNVVEADLERSGLFEPIERAAFLEPTLGSEAIPTFANWRKIDAQALVTGTVSSSPGGKLTVSFRLWDVLSERQYAGKSFTVDEKNWRRVSHLIADEIYKRLTGEEGYFDSRVVYVAETGSKKRPTKRLAIMDQDGANLKYLTSGKSLVLTPRFSPNSQTLIYMSYTGKVPHVYIYELETGRQKLLGSFDGMSFAPRFSHDGNSAIMSVSLDGNSEIFEMDLQSRRTKRLTHDSAIDTSPSYSSDGRHIVFNSDRGGSQQLYVMDRGGGNVKRISFGDGRYGTPVWSPRGDLIAFTKMKGGRFHIGVMRSDGTGERILTESYLDEGPTWSPNGRVIMFSRQSKGSYGSPSKTYLYSIDLTGYNERLVKTETEASDPAWSPRLQ